MAFLRKTGKYRKIPFAIVYSGLQKGLRGNLLTLAIEMAREFEDYPNALKKRLIQNVAEDCCDWELIMRIFNTPSNFNDLIQFVPEICAHIKCRDATFGFRVAVEFPDAVIKVRDSMEAKVPTQNEKLYILKPNLNDSLLELLIKEKTAARYNKLDDFGKFMEELIFRKYNFKIDFHKVYMFSSKNRSIVDSTIAYLKREYTHFRPEKIEELRFLNTQDKFIIPDFVFDKHTGNYAKNKNYDYFLNNMIISPRRKMTYLEKLARELYIKVNKRTRDLLILNPIKEPLFIDKKTELPIDNDNNDIQKQLQNQNINQLQNQPELLKLQNQNINQLQNQNINQIQNQNMNQLQNQPQLINQQLQNQNINQLQNININQLQNQPELPNQQLQNQNINQIQNQNMNQLQNQPQLINQNQQLINLSKIEHLQTQLITSKHKPKTFYISFSRSQAPEFSHVLKFPMNQNDINNMIMSDKFKNLFGLISLNIKQIQVIDSFNNFNNGIIMTNFNTQIDSNNIVIKSSKLENEVVIYNGNHLHLEWDNLYNLTHDEQINYLKILAFRYIIGTNDTTNRNILKVESKFISIDDPALFISPKMIYKSPIPIKHRQIFSQILNSNFQEIQNWLQNIMVKNIFCQEQINKLMNINNWIY